MQDEPHFSPKGAQKTKMRKEEKNVKNVFEKVSLTTVSHFRPPQSTLLENKVPESMVSMAFAHKRAFHLHGIGLINGFDVNNKVFLTKSRREKKSEKVKLYKKHMFSQSGCPK